MKIAVAALAVCSFGLVACTNPQAPHPQSIATQKSEESPAPLVEATTPDEVTSDVLPEITSDSDGRSVCLSFSDHKLEICTAYVVNASLESRLPFYKLGRSTAVGYYKAVQEHCTGKSAGAAADCRLKSRYYDIALKQISMQTPTWPAEVNVDFPHIKIVDITEGTTDTAVLSTVESWSVHTKDGKPLFVESSAPHTITMQRVQGLILHKWVVTNIH